MRRARIAVPAAFVALLAIAVVAAGNAVAGPSDSVAEPLGPSDVTVTLTIQHSRFSPDHFSVRPGTTVRFIVRNAARPVAARAQPPIRAVTEGSLT